MAYPLPDGDAPGRFIHESLVVDPGIRVVGNNDRSVRR